MFLIMTPPLIYLFCIVNACDSKVDNSVVQKYVFHEYRLIRRDFEFEEIIRELEKILKSLWYVSDS